MNTICYTSFSYAYLPRARVLAETLRAAHPDWTLWAVLVDRPPPGLPEDALAAFDHVLDAEALDIPRVRPWLFKHDLVEAATAVKGAALRRLLADGADRVVYLDPDIAVFHPLRFPAGSVLLTPHQLQPETTPVAIADNEHGSLRHGVFNLGFVAVCNTPAGRAFADWWAARLHAACYDDIPAGLFTDQKYLDLAPALFDDVGIVRDPGWNVATWNLSRRRIEVQANGDITANGSPLAFYHFTKHGGVGEAMLERYAAGRHEPHELWHWYGRRLAAHAVPEVPRGWWHYGRFDDGTPIPRAARLLFRSRPDLMAAFDDPYEIGPDSLQGWMRAHAPEVFSPADRPGVAAQ